MMSHTRDPRCVYVADSTTMAVVVADYLNNAGVPAQVMGLEAGTALPPAAATGEAEVWVDRVEQIGDAKALLAEHEKENAERVALQKAHGPVDVLCEECGKRSTFPAEQLGTTQVCPHCGEYVDVSDAPIESTEPRL